jgi:HEAT repeat protein
MRKRLKYEVILIGVIAVYGLARFLADREDRLGPTWQGKRLSYWLVTQGVAPDVSDAAVRQLGTNCIRLLLRWVRLNEHDYETPGYVRTLNGLLDRLQVIKFRFGSEWRPNRTTIALEVFAKLGPQGKAGIAGLVRLLGNDSDEVTDNASNLLKQMQPESISALTNALANRNPRVRAAAATTLAGMGAGARSAVPILRRMLNEKPINVRFAAVCALMKLGADPDPLVPVLIQIIKEGDHEMRGYAFDRLASLGERALPAVPELRTILTNTPLADVRFDIQWTLKMIELRMAAQPAPVQADPESSERSK